MRTNRVRSGGSKLSSGTEAWRARKAPPLTDEDGAVQAPELHQQLTPRLEDGQTSALLLHGLGVRTGGGVLQGSLLLPSAAAAATARREQHLHSLTECAEPGVPREPGA